MQRTGLTFVSALCLGIKALAGLSAASTQYWYYPQVDQSTYWGVGSWSNATLSSATKQVKTDSTTTVTKDVFASVTLHGLRVNGSYYTRSQLNVISEGTQTIGVFRRYYGYYDPSGTNYRLFFEINLHKDGMFRIQASWTTADSHVLPPSSGSQIYVRVDYDLGTGSSYRDDLVEYNDKSQSPHCWVGPASDCQVTYTASSPIDSQSIEYEPFCRIVDGSSATTQFSAVFWPYIDRPVKFYFMNGYNDNWAVPPSSSGTYPLQSVYTQTGYQPYAYDSYNLTCDQVLYATLFPDATYGTYGVHGKVFQKGNSRSMRVYTYTMTGASAPNLSLVVDSNRTAGDAFGELGKWQHSDSKTGISNPYGTLITSAELHNFLQNARSTTTSIYTTDNRTNFQDWYVEFCSVNCRWDTDADGYLDASERDVLATTFDVVSNSTGTIERSAAAAFWPAITGFYSNDTTRILAFLAAHELGHCFNFNHHWGSCGWNYQPTDSPPCTGYESLMTYSYLEYSGANRPYQHVGNTSMHWYGSGAHGEGYSDTPLEFYQKGPESWVKSGKMGCDFVSWTSETSPPGYYDY